MVNKYFKKSLILKRSRSNKNTNSIIPLIADQKKLSMSNTCMYFMIDHLKAHIEPEAQACQGLASWCHSAWRSEGLCMRSEDHHWQWLHQSFPQSHHNPSLLCKLQVSWLKLKSFKLDSFFPFLLCKYLYLMTTYNFSLSSKHVLMILFCEGGRRNI